MRRLIVLSLAALFSQAQQPQAYVLGQPVTGQRLGTPINPEPWKPVAAQIRLALIENYCLTHGLEPTTQEIAAVRSRMNTATLRAEVRKGADQLRSSLIRAGMDEQKATRQAEAFASEETSREEQLVLLLIRSWKFGRVLFQQYGGRVRLSAFFGIHEPMDAMEHFLIEQEKLGSFSIPDLEFRAKVWAVFQDKTNGGGAIVSGARAAAVYTTPPWEQPRR